MPLNPTPKPRQDPEMDNFIYGGGPRPRPNPRLSNPIYGANRPRRPVRWVFYALALIAIPLRMWWDAPLICAHFGWFCR